MRGQQFGALGVASRHYFAACSRHVACLAMMGMTLCAVSAAATVFSAQPAKTVVQKSVMSGQEGESNIIPFEQLATNNSWASSNHTDGSVSSQSWEIKSPGGEMELSFDYEVSSESGCDWLTITLDGNELVRVSGEVKDHYSVNGLPAGNHVLTATYSKDGSVSNGNDLGIISNITTSDAVNMAQAFLTNLGDYKGLEQELTAALQPVVDNREDSVAYVALCTTYVNVVKAYNYWPIIQDDIKIAGDVLAGGAYVDIAEAVKLGEAISLATSQSADYIAAYNALETSLAVYNSDKVEMSDWAFNTNTYYTIDGLNYYLDETNGLAAFTDFRRQNVSMESLDIPVTVRRDGKTYAVVAIMPRNNYGQENIKSITLPKTLRYIGNNGLAYYYNVAEITIPENVEYIGNDVFYNDNSLTRVKSEAAVPPSLGSFGRNNLKITIPRESFHAYRLVAVWNSNNVLIGGDEGVTVSTGKIAAGELGHFVVDEATYLQEVNKLVVEGNLNNDDWNTIAKMTNLTEVDLSGVSLETVPSYAFNGRWAIDKVVLPESVTSIGESAFQNSGVKSVNMPERLTAIGAYAFNGSKLEELNLPEGLTAIGAGAFYNSKLEELNLPESLLELGNEAFKYNDRLTSVKIPSKITVIPTYCFQGCSQLAKVELPDGIVDIKNYAFSGCTSLESVNFPNTLHYIRSQAFSKCSSLKNIQFNEGLIGIYNNAFSDCTGLTELVLPSSLEYCSGHPFSNCSGIKTVESRAVLPPNTGGNNNPLSGVDLSQLVLYVPAWSVNEYQLADGWNSFYTFEATDFMPQNIKVNKDFYFSLREETDPDYRPNIELTNSENQKTDQNGNYVYETGNITVSSRSKLAVNDFSFVESPFAKYYADQNSDRVYGRNVRQNATSLIVNGEMRAENVTLFLCNTTNRWQFVSFPFDVKVGDIVPQIENTSWVIRSHSGKNRAEGKTDEVWQNLTADDVLEAGKGYIMHCYSPNYNAVGFTVKPLTTSVNRQLVFDGGDRTMQLEENLAEFEHNRSWNLIGNPYPSFYDSRFLDFGAPFMVWNSYRQNYEAYNPADDAYIFAPGEAFFVQRPVDEETITFRNEGRQTNCYARTLIEEQNAPQRVREAGRQVYNFTIANGEQGDRTRVVINDAASTAYELTRDAAKFSGTEPTVPQIYTIDGNTRYAINERPLAQGTVQLGVHCGTDGEYTIALSGEVPGTVILDDKELGVSTELTAERGYTFTAAASDYNSRFALRFMPGATAIEGVTTGETAEGGDIYTLQGVKTTDAAAKQQKGVYIQKGKKVIKK